MQLATVSWPLGVNNVDTMMAQAAALRLTGVQYCGDPRQCPADRVKRAAAAHNIRIIAIDPLDCAPPHPAQATAERAVAFYRTLVDYARDTGCGVLTLQGLSQWTKQANTKQEAYAQLVACVRDVAAYAHEQGVSLLYEVCNHYEVPLIHTAREGLDLLDEVGSEAIRLILDSFHMNINEPSPVQAILAAGDRLGIYHISDSNRAGIGSGNIDFLAQYRALKQIGFSGDVAIELVLPHLTPMTPPQTEADRRRLDAEIRRSAAVWQALAIEA
ncbi:sugar phosphate isomerase/epimerase [Chimaeribacter arupi]|uniref:Sugar phosphate isomerase/epimerase n=2 Tax=Yersiniaceae TaxID=1903411 RepID=A0A2N5ESG9_9GAMM|nr:MULTISPECIES: sugar phosphate isomerase/epimerase family protein [Yersiniaceae]MBS0971384.1 sugar phosphate isomerase/epimerase [Nissabacter archeti]MDV5139063.1 sugar phosphate isomerase/epimerase family protein [Chimaeribacter arupi]PLR31949.1 sugar phosphate isomerase/epimerase [Chimaeribacter arupi]PLR45346.1 sugar phosphate isomerase/epimerase [Chimaeribacter arupi]PLR53041.1 sugar phosphate isomerase/epimerase [Chimaeribacter arupi]